MRRGRGVCGILVVVDDVVGCNKGVGEQRKEAAGEDNIEDTGAEVTSDNFGL